MHDCNGKPIEMFAKVRPATADELKAAGHAESEGTASYMKPGRAIKLSPGNACCEVTVAADLRITGWGNALDSEIPLIAACSGFISCKAKQLVVED